jgi:transcriptional regulator with XRE-family HTH domain
MMLGERIKQLRTAHNYSQVQLAAMLHVSKQAVSNWENNNIQPSVDMLVQIADLFAVSTDYLLEREQCWQLQTSGLTDEQLAHLNFIIQDILQS